MTFKCENVYCPYGPEWDRGEEATKDADGKVPVHLRADSYSQNPAYRKDGRLPPFNGLCLNCIDDENRERLSDF